MVYPDSVNMDDEDRNVLKTVGTDLNTFMTENYLMFVDATSGPIPISTAMTARWSTPTS